MRTFCAILIAALSGALAAPSASPQIPENDNQAWSAVEIALEGEFDLVAAIGDGLDEESALLADLALTLEIEGITDSGLRYGAVIGARGQRDNGRRAWGGLAGDCPAGLADCAMLGGAPGRGLTGGFYTDGVAESAEARGGLETGYVFLRSGLGELRLGYGPGAAALDGDFAPGAFRLSRADGGLVDATGLAGARTLNAASGFAPKLLVRSSTFGQASTLGAVRGSASYTPDAEGCGVDVCLYRNTPGGPAAPQLGGVFELAGEYEISRGAHVFTFSLGAARGEGDGPAGAADLESENASLSWRREGWGARLAYLQSNNGVAGAGDYRAWSGLLSYESGDWLTALEATRFSDDFAHLAGHSLQLGASRLLGEGWILGAGVQHAEREEPVLTAAGRRSETRRATAAFLELGWRF